MMHRGFTLFETLIYTAILSIFIGGSIGIMRILLSVRSRVQTTSIVQENMNFVFAKLGARIHAASAITAPAIGVSSTQLTLTLPDATLQPTIVSVSNGTVFLQQGAGSAIPLTSNEIQVSTLNFLRLDATPDQVQVSMTGWISHVTSTIFTLKDTFSIRR